MSTAWIQTVDKSIMYEKSDDSAASHKAGGIVVVAQLVDDDTYLGGRSVDKLVVADVKAHMGGAGAGVTLFKDNQVAWLEFTHGDGGAVVQLAGAGAIQAVAELLIHIAGKAGAVKAAGRGAAAVNVAITLELA